MVCSVVWFSASILIPPLLKSAAHYLTWDKLMGGFSHESDLPQSEIVNVYRTTGLTLACIGLLFGMFYRPKTESGTLKLRTAMSALTSSVIVFIAIFTTDFISAFGNWPSGHEDFIRLLFSPFIVLYIAGGSLVGSFLGFIFGAFMAHLWRY